MLMDKEKAGMNLWAGYGIVSTMEKVLWEHKIYVRGSEKSSLVDVIGEEGTVVKRAD
jgi:hypothetical protein